MENEEIGKRIKQRRNDMEISIMELVEATGLSKATLHRYESGDIKNIKIPVINTIARRLGVSPDWLMGKTDNMNDGISSPENDMHVILTYAIRTIRNGDHTNKGEEIPKEIMEILELTLEYQLKLLNAQLDNKK